MLLGELLIEQGSRSGESNVLEDVHCAVPQADTTTSTEDDVTASVGSEEGAVTLVNTACSWFARAGMTSPSLLAAA